MELTIQAMEGYIVGLRRGPIGIGRARSAGGFQGPPGTIPCGSRELIKENANARGI